MNPRRAPSGINGGEDSALQTVPPDIDYFLNERQLLQRLGFSRATLWRLRRARRFPEPIRLSDARVGWPVAQVSAWLAARPTTRDHEGTSDAR